MATKKHRAREAQLAFEALSIEGGLLSPEWLSRVAQVQANGQSETDYRVPKGLNLRDEIGRYWRVAQAHWSEFNAGRLVDKMGTNGLALAERFVLGLLRDAFGFTSLAPSAPVELAGHVWPIRYAALSGQVPVIIAAPARTGDAEGETQAPRRSGLDILDAAFGDEGRRRSASGLAQEFLNAEERALWGIASDGLTLRILRDNVSLTRPAKIETDLDRIFTEFLYPDFAALWLLLHETRFGSPGRSPSECGLEVWRNAGREEGTRARGLLRGGVEKALIELGQGFLSHKDNQALRTALHEGKLSTTAFFQQLLRLAYRIIFVLTAEERDVLHPKDVPAPARALYEEGYGLRRLRDRAVRRSAHDRFGDLWEGLKIVWRGLARGEPSLGLPALAGLFSIDQCPDLDGARLENFRLLLAVFNLSWIREESGAGLSRVNWRDMGPEELGSVYESLLELVPRLSADFRGFAFATGGETKGNARKTSGSYYTPDSLVQVLLDSALEPVVKDALAALPKAPVEALLSLTIVDPACGSGHFLLAAARRLAAHVARLQANGTPSADQYRAALRQVVGRCIFGVDLNPMAVELCKVALWMEAVEPGRPLSFLNSHIQHGNSLLGTTPELMGKGLPDEAWEPIEGDDKKTASALKRRNRAAAAGQRGLDTLWARPADNETAQVTKAVAALDAAPDADVLALVKKQSDWDEIRESGAFRHQKFVADAWCAAFMWPKPPIDPKHDNPFFESAPTNEVWRQIRDGKGQPTSLAIETTQDLAARHYFFHWHLMFPQVFEKGGFDVVLGNPPYGHLSREPERPLLLYSYPLAAGGEAEHYALFVGAMLSVLRTNGLLAFVLPDSWMSNEYRRDFRKNVAPLVQELIDFGKPFEAAKDTHVQGLVAGRYPVASPLRASILLGQSKVAFSPTPRHELFDRVERSWCPYLSAGQRSFVAGLESEATPLETTCDVVYGLRTGNNKKYLVRSPVDGPAFKAFGGEDIVPFGAVWKTKYLVGLDGPLLAAAQEQAGHRKLAVQRIRTNSASPWARWLEVGLAPVEVVCLDSVTYMMAEEEDTLWFVLGLLSSTPMNQYHRLVTTDVNVKPTFLRRLPVPSRLHEAGYKEQIVHLARLRADEVSKGDSSGPEAPALEREMDALIYQGAGISLEVVREIEERHWGERFAVEFERLRLGTLRVGTPASSLSDQVLNTLPGITATQLDPASADLQLEQELQLNLPMFEGLLSPPMTDQDLRVTMSLFALLRVRGGRIGQFELARASTLLFNPSLLIGLAPPTLKSVAELWARTVSPMHVGSGVLASTVNALESRQALAVTSDAGSSVSTILATPHTPAQATLDPWFVQEAALALGVLAALSPADTSTVEASLTGADRNLIQRRDSA